MSTNPKVSLIIPVYNVERYLQRCLDSVEKQTYENYEVILVDDGSTDSSGEMCELFAHSHANTIVIHQKNQGLSVARNQGSIVSTGEYLSFVDSDDYITPDYIEYLVYLITKYGTPMSATRRQTFYQDMSCVPNTNHYQDGVLKCEEALNAICYGRPIGITATAKMLRREIVLNHPYPPQRFYEDLATTHWQINDCDKIAYGTKTIYYYYQRKDSIMHMELTDKNIYDGINGANELIQFMKEYHPQCINAAYFRYLYKIIEFFPALMDKTENSKNRYNMLKKLAMPALKKVIFDGNVFWKSKIKFLFVLSGYKEMRQWFSYIDTKAR